MPCGDVDAFMICSTQKGDKDNQATSAVLTWPFNRISKVPTESLGDPQDLILGMSSVQDDDRSLTDEPDHQFILELRNSPVNNLHFFDSDLYPAGSGPYTTSDSNQINRISNRLGPVPLLSQMDEIPQDMFCNDTTVGTECQTEWCECIHKLTVHQGQLVEMVFTSPSGAPSNHPLHAHGYSYRVVAMGKLVEMVFISPTGARFTHPPMHTHGYGYRVVAMERGPNGIMTPELFREMDARVEIHRKRSRAPLKDTIPIPDNGYLIVRFVADNPGVWFIHCHLVFHTEVGMSLSLEVLQPDGQLPPPPPGFHTCGPFVPPSGTRHPEGTPDDAEQKKLKAKNPSQQQASTQNGSNPNSTTTVLPQWVLPLVTGMGVVIVALVIAVVSLCKRNKNMVSTEERRHFPYYQSTFSRTETSTNGGKPPGEGSDDHFSYSRKDERTALTR